MVSTLLATCGNDSTGVFPDAMRDISCMQLVHSRMLNRAARLRYAKAAGSEGRSGLDTRPLIARMPSEFCEDDEFLVGC